jgi:hypothetical protein
LRKSKLSAAEIEAAEQAADKRKSSRKQGFSMMDERDRGWKHLSNGAVFFWPVPREKRENGLTYLDVPEGHFVLVIGGREILFNADEMQGCLRWV